MSFWDYVLPHRLLINKSLRKEAEDLRTRIDAYQIEYEEKVEACQAELVQVEQEKQKKFDEIKNTLVKDFNKEKKYLEKISQDIILYVDLFLRRNCQYQMKDIKERQYAVLKEDYEFLSKQMSLIGEEIELLRARQAELSSFTEIDDIVSLANDSGCELDFEEGSNAERLLEIVSNALAEKNESQNIEKIALLRLKGVIHERSEYIPTIKYIEWVIQQKIQISKQLAEKRNEIRLKQESVQKEVKKIEKDNSLISKEIDEIASQIRNVWAKPITFLNADISYAYKEKEEISNQLADVRSEIEHMKAMHSDDSYKWERLQSEIKDLYANLKETKDQISSKKDERKEWYERRDEVYKMCKINNVPLIPEKKNKPDEIRIIEERLCELREKREEQCLMATQKAEQKKKEINTTYAQLKQENNAKLDELVKIILELKSKRDKSTKRVNELNTKLNQLKKADNRLFISKIMSDTPEISAAKTSLANENKELSAYIKKISDTEKSIKKAQEDKSIIERQHKDNLQKCKPVILGPTEEEEKLKYRRHEIEMR